MAKTELNTLDLQHLGKLGAVQMRLRKLFEYREAMFKINNADAARDVRQVIVGYIECTKLFLSVEHFELVKTYVEHLQDEFAIYDELW